LQLTTLFVVLAAGWLVQMVLAYLQAQRFMRRVRILRRAGTVAIGRGGSLVRGRAYVALAATPDGNVAAAEVLRGLTVLASPRPLPAAVGHPVAELAAGDGLPGRTAIVRAAAQQAATTLRDQLPKPRTTAQRTRREPAPVNPTVGGTPEAAAPVSTVRRTDDREPRSGPASGGAGDPRVATDHDPRPTREGDRCPQTI
jgi:DNA-binding transcriptional regulator of glucitol operon